MIIASVVLPIRNEEDTILPCLQSIIKNTYPKTLYEIILVDGNSTDQTLEKIGAFDWKGIAHSVLHNPAKIVPVALNMGIRASKGKYIIRMDAHTQYDEAYISQCVQHLDKKVAHNVGGPMRAVGTNAFGQAVARATSAPLGVGNARFHFDSFEGFTDTVYLGAFDKSVFDKVGYFDESFVRNQDDEFNLRLSRAGYKIYCTPKIKSVYTPRSTAEALWRQYYQYGFWKVRVIQKHHIPASWRHLIPGSFVLSSILLLPTALFSNTALCLLAGVNAIYGVAILMQTVFIKRKHPRVSGLYLPLIFPILHFSYGSGFLVAVLRFLFKKK